MKNFETTKLEDSKLELLLGGTEIIEESGDFLIDTSLDFIVEDEPAGW